MRVARLGVSVLKGAAQQHPDRLRLDDHGPVDDRRYALLDPVTGAVLKTVENPGVLGLRAAVVPPVRPGAPETLVVEVPGRGRTGVPVATTGTRRADYWGRGVDVEVVGGGAAGRLVEAVAAHLGRDVVLVRARPRDVVWGEGVTLVTTSSLEEVERRRAAEGTGGPVRDLAALVADAERWRAALVVATPGLPPFVEDAWHGRRLVVGTGPGAVVLQVTGGVARCAVVRGRPRDGAREDWDPLRLLAPDRLRDTATGREVSFAVGAEVTAPGIVGVGDAVALLPPG